MINFIDTFPGREVLINGKTYLYFGGTSYLGLQYNTDFQEILIENIRKYGTNYGASRKSNVQFSIYEEAENYLAKITGAEAAVTLSSGYLAGQLVAGHFENPDYKLFYAPHTHSALYNSNIVEYSDYESLNLALRNHTETNSKVQPVVLLDAIEFSGLNYPDFTGLKTLPLDEVILIADDSHGIGIIGEEGGGVYKYLKGLNPKELLVCFSLGKSLGISAGAILGTKKRIDELKNTVVFGGGSPASPANIATLLQSQAIFSQQRKKLQENILWFKTKCKNLDQFVQLKNHPVFSHKNTGLSLFMADNGIIATSFAYPQEDSPVVNKIVISAGHTPVDIDKLATLINQF